MAPMPYIHTYTENPWKMKSGLTQSGAVKNRFQPYIKSVYSQSVKAISKQPDLSLAARILMGCAAVK